METECEACGEKFRAKNSQAGKKVVCSQCSAQVNALPRRRAKSSERPIKSAPKSRKKKLRSQPKPELLEWLKPRVVVVFAMTCLVTFFVLKYFINSARDVSEFIHRPEKTVAPPLEHKPVSATASEPEAAKPPAPAPVFAGPLQTLAEQKLMPITLDHRDRPKTRRT